MLTISYNPFHSMLNLRPLHTVVTNKCAWIRSIYQLLIRRSQMWNSEIDVQRRWLCAPVTSRSDVQHYVDFKFLHWLLPIIDQYQWQFVVIEVTWQQASKQTNKSTICETVSVYRSQCIDVSGVKKAQGKFWSSCFKPCGLWHCFNW